MAKIPTPGPGRAQLAWAQAVTDRANLYEGLYAAKKMQAATTVTKASFTTTEVVVVDYTLNFTTPVNRMVAIHFRINFDSTVTNDRIIFRLRESGLGGTQVDEYVTGYTSAGVGHQHEATTVLRFQTAASKTYALTAQRLTGTGTCKATVLGPQASHYIYARDAGHGDYWSVI